MRKIIITAALTGLLLGTSAASAGAVPITPKTCIKDGVPVACVKYTWKQPAKVKRTWHGKVFDPSTRR